MTVLSVVKDVCLAVGVNPLTSLFTASIQPRTQAELLSLANEIAQRIANDAREWTAMKAINTFTGDGVKDRFPLPANYQRMLLTAQVYPSSTPTLPLLFISDTNDWLQRRLTNLAIARAEWTLIGNDMLIYPILAAAVPSFFTPGWVTAPWLPSHAYAVNDIVFDVLTNIYWYVTTAHTSASSGNFAQARAATGYWAQAVLAETVSFTYLDKNCVKLFSGGYGDQFMNDLDEFRLPERLLKLGMIVQWKINKGSPYAEDMGTYQDAMVMAMGSDKPAPIIVDRVPISAAVNVALPWPVGWGASP